mgnify:CR=1 FL=1
MKATPLVLRTTDADFEARFQQRLHWSAATDAAIEQRVAEILADVRSRGDAAVIEYTQRFDGLQVEGMAGLELTQAELKAAFDGLPEVQREALQAAAARVRRYHEAQKRASGESWSYRDEDGTLLGQKVTPLDRVGIYVPGGKAAYPSSVLMNALPAHVAGVGEERQRIRDEPADDLGHQEDRRGGCAGLRRRPAAPAHQGTVCVGHHLQCLAALQQLARLQQELGPCRPADALVAGGEGLVQQHAARRQGVEQVGQHFDRPGFVAVHADRHQHAGTGRLGDNGFPVAAHVVERHDLGADPAFALRHVDRHLHRLVLRSVCVSTVPGRRVMTGSPIDGLAGLADVETVEAKAVEEVVESAPPTAAQAPKKPVKSYVVSADSR